MLGRIIVIEIDIEKENTTADLEIGRHRGFGPFSF